MPRLTPIQWCHDTVNPVQGCEGCPLWPTYTQLHGAIVAVVLREVPGASLKAIEHASAGALADYVGPRRRTTALTALDQVARRFSPEISVGRLAALYRPIAEKFRCYAGNLSQRFSGNNPGYARSFDAPEKFPGRTQTMAMLPEPTPSDIKDKPWLKGLRRLIFVSDMGDALSSSIPFDYLKQEIVDIVTAPAGARHTWLWLTKRPARMAAFSDWLQTQGVDWPANLVPMCSILDGKFARQAATLRRIPALTWGLSVEPLDAAIELPEQILGPTSWVIVGGESGVGATRHPFALEWARRLRAQCRRTNTPFFMKQLGSVATENGEPYHTVDRHGGEWAEWPADLRIREFPEAFRLDPKRSGEVEHS